MAAAASAYRQSSFLLSGVRFPECMTQGHGKRTLGMGTHSTKNMGCFLAWFSLSSSSSHCHTLLFCWTLLAFCWPCLSSFHYPSRRFSDAMRLQYPMVLSFFWFLIMSLLLASAPSSCPWKRHFIPKVWILITLVPPRALILWFCNLTHSKMS